jgi:hypothetical protein
MAPVLREKLFLLFQMRGSHIRFVWSFSSGSTAEPYVSKRENLTQAGSALKSDPASIIISSRESDPEAESAEQKERQRGTSSGATPSSAFRYWSGLSGTGLRIASPSTDVGGLKNVNEMGKSHEQPIDTSGDGLWLRGVESRGDWNGKSV